MKRLFGGRSKILSGLFRTLPLLAVAGLITGNLKAVTVTGFSPSVWPRPDAELGISGFHLEDFEDAVLIPQLRVQLSGGTMDYGPTATLPHAFDPAEDPNAQQVLLPGRWDGFRVLLNRHSAPIPSGYVDGQWADTTFHMPGGALSLGFSVQQLEVAGTAMTVTTTAGVVEFNLGNIPGFSPGGGRNGYLRIDAGPGELLLSARIDNRNGDGMAFDHAAVRMPALLWNLTRDWSDTVNPNGVWSLREGTNLLPVLASGWQVSEGWDRPQQGFAEAASGNQRIPFWFRSNGAETFSPDTLSGDIVVHTTDEASGTGNGPASVVWTSPISGTISILGRVWMTREVGRANEWKLYHNGLLLRNGQLSSGDAYNRACPFGFENGTSPGVPGPYNVTVAAGDEIRLEIVRTSQFGDFVGVDLTIVPGSVWTAGTGANHHIYIPVKAPAGIAWAEAEAAAVAAGGHLASIGSAEENSFVQMLVADPSWWLELSPGGPALGPWIGGLQTPLGSEPAGGWQWSDGRGFSFNKWAPGQPDNSGGNENRTVFFSPGGGPGGDWADLLAVPAVAARPRGYVIELQPARGQSTGWTTGTGANGHRYQAVPAPDGITWAEAEADAVARGGHLASINSAAENAFVYALVGSRPEYWYYNSFNAAIGPFIGGFQPDGSAEPAGGWSWTDGTPFSYTNWSGGEPNNSGNTEKQLHFYGGSSPSPAWNDISPSVTALGYIVEYAGLPDVPAGPEFADMLYLTAQQSNTVLQYRLAPTGPPQLLRTLTGNMNRPSGIVAGPGQDLFVVQRGDPNAFDARISRWFGSTGTPADEGLLPPAAPPLGHAHGAVFRGEDLIVVDSRRDQLRRFRADTAGIFAEALPAISLEGAGGLARYVAVHPGTGEVFAGIAGGIDKIRRFIISGGGTVTANGEITGNGMNNPHGVTFSPWGELFVSNLGGNSISRFTFNPAGTAIPNGVISGNGLNGPVGAAFSPWSELFVSNYNGGSISRFTFEASGAALANGSFTVPASGAAGLVFVRASAPDLPPPCQPGTTTSVSSGMIAWWKGDDNALDATGRHPGVEENAVSYQPGRFGQAFSVGSSTPGPLAPRVNLGHLPELKAAEAWTFSAWIRVGNASPGLYWLGLPVGNISAGSGAPYYGRGLWATASPTPGHFHPQFFTFSNTINYSASVVPFPIETWTHVAGVWRGADGFAATYVNGNLASSSNGTAGSRFPEGNGDLMPAYIGALGFVTGSTSTLNTSHPCLFDDVRLYSRALGGEEIALIASGEDFNTCPPSDAGLPPLTISRVPSGVRVSWPERYTGWSLESSGDGSGWTPVIGTPVREAAEFVLVTPAEPARNYFRLRLQSN